MKKIITLCLSLCLLSGGMFLESAFAESGRVSFDFTNTKEVYENFDFYTEAVGHGFYLNGEYLCSSGRSENKAIYKTQELLTQYTLEADFHKVNDIAPIDAGFYIHASSASGKLDDIRAYNVNIEKPIKSNSVIVKIHKFDKYYCGEIASVGLTVKSYPINLEVCVDLQNVKVFINKGQKPILDVNLSELTLGSVGLRAFRGVPTKISNFKLTALEIPADTQELDSIIAEAEKITDLTVFTKESAEVFASELKKAKSLTSKEQSVIDQTVEDLRKAINNLLLKGSYEELENKIKSAESIISTGENLYTYNTFTALKIVTTRAKKITRSSSEQEIAEFINSLNRAINNLVKYN